MQPVDPHLLDTIYDGHYWTRAPRIDPDSLPVVTRLLRRLKPWAPNIDSQQGIAGERPARILGGD